MPGQLYRSLIDILQQHGCYLVREAPGSHEVWHSPVSKRRFPVPSNISSRHLANRILKQAGIAKAL